MNSISKGRVLIIDDSPKNIQVAVSILENAGFECEFALNGSRGLTWLESDSFDAILLDIMMPEVDGFEVCQIIKSSPSFQDIPIIFLTAKVDRESIIKGFEVGGSDYITKPFDSKELLIRIKNQVELKKSRALLKQSNVDLERIVEDKTQKLIEANKELTKINLSLRESNDELKFLEESKQHFLNILGTGIASSLNEIVGNLQVIKYKVDSKKIALLIDRIDQSLSKVEIAVDSALRITKLQAKGEKLNLERIELNKFIGFSMLKLDDKIRRKQFKIENITNHEPIYILGESKLIMAALVNIIDFFLERNLDGSQLIIETKTKSQQVNILFKDNSQPISSDEADFLFDVFSPSNQSLHVSKLIAEIHFGEITIRNSPLAKGVELSLDLFTKTQKE